MRPILLLLLFGCLPLQAQSVLTIGPGAAIEVGSGADVCANSVTGSLIGLGTFCRNVTGANTPERSPLPAAFVLYQNYPNPFNPGTTIRYELPRSVHVSMFVYDLFGKEVARLVEGVREAGIHAMEWDARGVAGGVYYYRLNAGELSATRRLLLIR